MLFYLFLLFSIVELALLVWLGGQTAWWVPILLVLADGVAGALLIRWQGWRALARIQDELRQGRMPADALVDGVLIVVAGLLLIAPGMLTDAVGFALLIPPLRHAVKRAVAGWLRRSAEIRAAQFTAEHGADPWQTNSGNSPADHAEIIDARVINSRVEDAD